MRPSCALGLMTQSLPQLTLVSAVSNVAPHFHNFRGTGSSYWAVSHASRAVTRRGVKR